jgi:hypothetical protein
MKKYRVYFLLDGHPTETIVFAASTLEAERLIKTQFPKAYCINVREAR